MLFACSNRALPASSSRSGACHPPYKKPVSRSSSGPPGTCATPSSVMNSVTMSFPMVSPLPGGDASRYRRWRRSEISSPSLSGRPATSHASSYVICSTNRTAPDRSENVMVIACVSTVHFSTPLSAMPLDISK